MFGWVLAQVSSLPAFTLTRVMCPSRGVDEADVVLLGRYTGAVTLRDAATGKSWHVNTR